MGDYNNLENFELLLKRSAAKRPAALYDTTKNINNTTIKPQDVLDSVYSQIRVMQLADGRSSKIGGKDINVVKSSFLAVNKLPVYNEVPKQKNTFETQCVSDTQLINIIEDAEALIDNHKGMTQEFDTDFTHTNKSVTFSQGKTDRENMIEIQEFDTTFTQTNVDETVSFLHDRSKGDTTHSPCNENDQTQIYDRELETNVFNHKNVHTLGEGDKDIEEDKSSTKMMHSDELCIENQGREDIITFKNLGNYSKVIVTETKNEMIEVKDGGVMETDDSERERSLSPVLKVKSNTKMAKPLVFPLESFERFERIAIPLIDSNHDLNTCKHLINSQILGGELCLNTYEDVMFSEKDQLSPIIEKSYEIFQNNSEQLETNIVTNLDKIKSRDKRSNSLKDEILFSSDEENDFIYREFQDMPLTAALETSFYDHSNVLEETMYVGFQTASNKSIQICKESFQKAQFILDEDDNINGKDFSLAELVEICDEKSVNNTSTADLKVQEKLYLEVNAVEAKSVVYEDSDIAQIKLNAKDLNSDEEMIEAPDTKVAKAMDYDDTIKKPPEQQSFIGFKTASNKKIDLSHKALDLGKKVFKDIDIDEEFDLIDKQILEPHVEDTKVKAEFNIVTNPDDIDSENYMDDKINDDLIIQEFENIEMSLEEKEKSCDEIKTIPFLGFKTASNRNIDISDAAKTKYIDIFQDIDLGKINESKELDIESTKMPQSVSSKIEVKQDYPEPTFIGFKTANNKNIEISAQALAKTKNIFQDIDKNIDNSDDNFELRPSKSKNAFVGFKTANNKDIKISEVALSKSSNIFKYIGKDPKDIENEEETLKPLFKGFNTASNMNVNISEQAFVKSRKIFQDIAGDNERNTEELIENRKDVECFGGFKIANDKAVLAENIASSNKLVKELDTVVSQNSHGYQPIADELKDDSRFKGFQTANKKPVCISSHALQITKMIFQGIDDNDAPSIALESNFKGFLTANNKEVAVTKEAVNASKKLFELNKDKSPFVGFKTASNKNVNVSKEALAKCKKIFDDLDGLPTETDVGKEAPKTTFGFQTANNKKVDISNEALEKKKSLFNDIEISENKIPTSKGFQTASKKNVEVSKEALEKTKSFFNDIEMPEVKEFSFKGFQTASKKKVTVSDQALAKTMQIFQDTDMQADDEVAKSINSNKTKVTEPEKGIFSLKTANKLLAVLASFTSNDVDVMNKSRMLQKNREYKDGLDINKNSLQKGVKIDTAVNVENIIDTQVLHNFEESLCTEDFKETPIKNKRSGSPILACPSAKRRKKFETPYKDHKDNVTKDISAVIENKTTCTIEVKFSENYKKANIYKLKDLKFASDRKSDIDPYITNFNLDNILNFEFGAQRNELTKTKVSVVELKRIFISAVNKNLVPEGWLDNHLKLILWKLLSYEMSLLNITTLCTVQNVIDQLKYRYDKELYNAKRPALRKILEKDDVSTKSMVLCVAGIYVDGVSVSSVTNTKDLELLLTDGWYFIKATIDKMLSKLVYDSKIVVGCKIITSGAELVNCDQGMSPWEDTTAVRLKIFGNSTRPAPWHAKLGYTRAAILTQLSTVKVDGGKISRLRVYVTRVYPMLYVEKFADGSTVTRSERLEHLHQIKYEAERELMMERIYEEVQKEFSDQESQDSELLEAGKRKVYESGSQIAKMMKISRDPMEFREQLTTSQVQLLQEHTCKHREKLLQLMENRVQEKLNRRNVVTLARGRIATVDDKMVITKGMLSIWKPNEAIMELFKEGSWMEVMNIIPTAMRYSEIQITAGRQSAFRPTKSKNKTQHLASLKRTCYKISDVTQNPTMTTDYNEIDTVGMVFLIEPSNREFESNRNFQNVYLTDADKNIISVNFWGGLNKFGFENILDTGQIVACVNLQKRAGNTRKNIPQYRVTEFSHFTKTPKNLQAREMLDDLNKKLYGLDRRKFCNDCIEIKNNYRALRCFNNSENESPYRFNKSDYCFARNKMFIDTPQGIKPNKNEDMNLNLTGLDFESSFKQETQDLSPKTMLRKKKVNEKIAKLKMYGEPPPLTPISIINKSVNAKNSYKSPLISVNSSVATPNNLQENSASTINRLPEESPKTRDTDRERSPVLSVKRIYVRSVPVKLNFTNENKNDLVDHFAEEFDGSPPLSLD